MLISIFFVIFLKLSFSFQRKIPFNTYITELTDNLIANLGADPSLIGESSSAELQETSKEFIDKHIEQYKRLVLTSQQKEFYRSKRSLGTGAGEDDGSEREDRVTDLLRFTNSSLPPSKDVRLFQQRSQLYLVSLEITKDMISDLMRIMKYQNGSFTSIKEFKINNGERVATFNLGNRTLLVVAENSHGANHDTNIYQFSLKEELSVIHQLEGNGYKDVTIWEDNRNVFMSLVGFMGGSAVSTSSISRLYKWLGGHFDFQQEFRYGATRISPFTIGNSGFIAVSYVKSEDGEENDGVYSEILKYNVNTDKYELFQKILTYGCEDIKYLEIDIEDEKEKGHAESFLVVANLYQEDTLGHKDFSKPSIVYKYSDNYFYPFQGINQHGVVQWEPIQDIYGNALLLALTLDGIKAYQYDGWHFLETSIQFKEDFGKKNVSFDTIHTLRMKDKNLLVAASLAENETGIFEIKISPHNEVKEKHDELLTWCEAQIGALDKREENILGAVQQETKQESESQTKNVNITDLIQKLEEQHSKLAIIEEKLQNSLQSSQYHYLDQAISAKKIIINSTAEFDEITVNTINNINVKNLMNNTLNVHEGFSLDSDIKANFIKFDSTVVLSNLNHQPISNIVYKHLEAHLKTMNINGTAKFEENVHIKNILNNRPIKDDNIFLKTKDPNSDVLRASQVDSDRIMGKAVIVQQLDKLKVAEANNKPTDSNIAEETTTPTPTTTLFTNKPVKKLKHLKVTNLIVDGLINDVEISVLEKYALKKVGKQNITGKFFVDKIVTEELNTESLSNSKVPEDFVTTTGSTIQLGKVFFTRDLKVKDLVVTRNLNGLQVNKAEELQILYKNSSEIQQMIGEKTFDNLELLSPLDMRGKKMGKAFDRFDTVLNVTTDLTLNKSIELSGPVKVQKTLKSKDIIYKGSTVNINLSGMSTRQSNHQSENSTVIDILNTNQNKQESATSPNTEPQDHTDERVESLLKVIQQGVKLTDDQINSTIKFLQPVNVEKIEVRQINGFNAQAFIIQGSKDPVEIKGWNTFEGDLTIVGDAHIRVINDIKTEDLENNVLTVHTDQTIKGKHHIKHVVIKESLNVNDSVKLGEHSWNDVVTLNGNQTIEGTVTVKDLTATSISLKNLQTDGQINGFNVSDMLKDLVPQSGDMKVFGTKTFETINITHLLLDNGFDLTQHIKDIKSKKLVLNNVDVLDAVTAKKVYFGKNCNGLSKEKFENARDSENGTINVDDEFEFDTITVHGNVFVENDHLNNVDMEDFEKNTVKIDEPFKFNDADFGKQVVVFPAVSLHGEIENLDLDNIFENGKSEDQKVLDTITFEDTVFINGTTNIDTINGVNVTEICGILSWMDGPRRLVVEGNVHFMKGPKIQAFNDLNARELDEKIWFTDTPAVITGHLIIDANVSARDSIKVNGLLNDINVEHISKNYLSKTKDQTIVARINITNTAIFDDDIATPEVVVHGKINNIKLDQFLKTILLHKSQLFEDLVYFEEVTAKELEGNYLVNKLNLDTEVMRYDRSNLITGTKTFTNLDVDILKPERAASTKTPPSKVQDVDIGRWMQTIVLKTGTYKINGTKTFRHIETRDSTSLIGTFNGHKLDENTIMMKSSDQNITGKKLFITKENGAVKFKDLEVKGLVNGEEFEKMMHNQAYRNEDNAFNTSLTFCNNITAKNVIFEKKYSNIDVPDLLNNITTLGTLNHIKEKYKSLQIMAEQVEKSLKGQAYFLDYYKRVLLQFAITDLIPLTCTTGEQRIVSFRNESGRNFVKLLEWNEELDVFVNSSTETTIGNYPNYINEFFFDDSDKVYIEEKIQTPLEETTHKGKFLTCRNQTASPTGQFDTKGTIFATSFHMKSQQSWCMLMVDFNFDINILCLEKDNFQHKQKISNPSPVMASVVQNNDLIFLVTIHKDVDNVTAIWALDRDNQFKVFETYQNGNPISVSTLSTNQGLFLVIAYKHLPNTQDFGRVVVRRFDKTLNSFQLFQTIHILLPIKVELSLLPSKEIVLYVVTENPTEPLAGYLYNGIEGFKKKLANPAIPKVNDIRSFSYRNQHFVVIKHQQEVTVLQGVFKGSKVEK